MKIVQQTLIDKLIDHIDKLMYKGKVKINGKYEDYTIFKTIKRDSMIRKYVYLDTEEGLIEEAQLLSEDGGVLAIKPFNIEKMEDGLVLAFEFKITVEEV